MSNVIFRAEGYDTAVLLYEDGTLYVSEGQESASHILTDEDKLNLIKALLK